MNTPKHPPLEVLDALRTRFRLDPVQGKVFNLQGREVGNKSTTDFYFRIWIYLNGKRIPLKRSHVIFWSYHNRWPESEIDHWDRNKGNDTISNLREVNRRQNCSNRYDRDLPVGVSTGEVPSRPYRAKAYGRFIGNFSTPEEASKAYQEYTQSIERKFLNIP